MGDRNPAASAPEYRLCASNSKLQAGQGSELDWRKSFVPVAMPDTPRFQRSSV